MIFLNKQFIKIKNFIKKYFFIFLGILIFAIYFWNRFLRPRTSKDLPLNLNVLGFFILLYICLIFTYILISLIFPRKQNKTIEMLINLLFTPLVQFDNYLKSLPFIKSHFEKALRLLIPKLDSFIIETNIFYTMFWIFPRLILLSALYIDVFIFQRFHYKYLVILFGLSLFFNRYFKYSLKKYKEDRIKYYSILIETVDVPYKFGIHPSEWPENSDPEDEDNDDIQAYMGLPLEIFIKYQTESKVYNNETIQIIFFHCKYEIYLKLWEKYIGGTDPDYRYNKPVPLDYKNIFGNKVPQNYNKAKNFILKKKQEYGKNAIYELLQISLLLEYYNKTSNQDKHIKLLKILIYLNYLICWLYVLLISLPSLDIIILFETLNNTWIKILEPFSENYIK